MVTGSFFRGVMPLAQIVGTLVALGVVATLPPPEGRVLLVPLTPDAAARVARLAIDHRALPVARIGRALLVESRGDFAGRALASGILPIAWSGGSCGDGAQR